MFRVSRLALSLCAGIAILAGCGGSQPRIGAAGALPQSATAQRTEHKALRSGSALLYVSGTNKVDFYALPGLQVAGSIAVNYPWALCSDSSGNVWIADDFGKLFKYAYGSTKLLRQIQAGSGPITGCSVDSVTGDIAAAEGGTDVVVISGKRKKHVVFYNDFPYYPLGCAYDISGNLYAVGNYPNTDKVGLSEMPNGSHTFSTVDLDTSGTEATAVQWDGEYVAFNAHLRRHKRVIYRVEISGSHATVKQTVNVADFGPGTFWIEGDNIFAQTRERNHIGVWPYPQGGQPAAGPDLQGASYVTVAVAPSRSRVHR
jgi:hypothetical protein